MDNHFDRLITVLDKEAGCYQKLLACIQAEKKAIVDLDFDALAKFSGQKETMLLQLRQLSARRVEALRELAEDLALPSPGITLEQLSRQAPVPYGGELQRCRRRLRN